MDINEIHKTILFILNKEQQKYLPPEEIDRILDRAQIALFNQYHDDQQLFRQDRAGTYGKSQRIDDALSTFKDRYLFTNIDTPGGVITLPTNYMHMLSLYTTKYSSQLGRNVYSGVQVMNEEELIERLESQVIPVGDSDPVAIMNKQNKIQLFPEQPTTGGVYYFRRPDAPKFGYTVSGRTITYNPNPYDPVTQPTGSVQLQWRDSDVNNIISMALSYYGINMSSGDIVQFAQLKQQEGQ